MKDRSKEYLMRGFAVVLALVMTVAYLPLLGNSAIYAGDEKDGYGTGTISSGELKQGEDYSGMVIYDGQLMAEEDLDAALAEEEGVDPDSEDEIVVDTLGAMEADVTDDEPDVPELTEAAIPETTAPAGDGGSTESTGFLLDAGLTADSAGDEVSASEITDYGMNVNWDDDGNAYVTAYIVGDGVSLDALYVDDELVTYFYGDTYISNYFLELSDYPVGPHNVIITLEGDSHILLTDHVNTYIYGVPDIKLSNFYTSWKYFTFDNSYSNSYDFDSDVQVYLDYKKSGGSYKTYGPIENGTTVKKSGLKAAKKYKARAFYGKEGEYVWPDQYGTYHSEDYFFKGDYSDTKTFKTAYKKTPIKSIKIKCRKQYSKKYRYQHIISTWWVGNVMWYKYRWKTGHAWYTKIKVTVKMKKKPGVKGIYIGNIKRKGNKKTYTKKLTMSGKKKGKKLKVCVQSYMSNTYGGWSKVTKKKVKVR